MLEDKELEFPCQYPIKVIGLNREGFYEKIYAIINVYVEDLIKNNSNYKVSSNGKYLSATFTFEACSREQVDKIYSDLNSEQAVITVL